MNLTVNKGLKKGVFLSPWLDLKSFAFAQNKFNFHDVIIITTPQDNFVECVQFGIPFDGSTSIYMLMQNINLLYWFISYFKDRAHLLIEQAKKQRIQLLDLPKDINSTIASTENNPFDSTWFLQHTKIKRFYLNTTSDNVYLTNREIDIIELSIKGKTLCKIAKQLCLSVLPKLKTYSKQINL